MDDYCSCKQNKGKKAYEIYCSWMEGNTYPSGDLPTWSALPVKTKNAWINTANLKKYEGEVVKKKAPRKPKKENQCKVPEPLKI